MYMYYHYYFESGLLDYNEKKDSIFTPDGDHFLYKLKDSYFFDINGDGLLDFIHYPKYYKKITRGVDVYELFIKEKDGYKWLTFIGFIVDIKFNKDGTLDKMTTFRGACCDDDHVAFFYYKFDKIKNELIIEKREDLLTCQLKNK